MNVNIVIKDILTEDIQQKYDIIYSNPPYLSKDEMKDITADVKSEPSLALYGGEDRIRIL